MRPSGRRRRRAGDTLRSRSGGPSYAVSRGRGHKKEEEAKVTSSSSSSFLCVFYALLSSLFSSSVSPERSPAEEGKGASPRGRRAWGKRRQTPTFPYYVLTPSSHTLNFIDAGKRGEEKNDGAKARMPPAQHCVDTIPRTVCIKCCSTLFPCRFLVAINSRQLCLPIEPR